MSGLDIGAVIFLIVIAFAYFREIRR